MVAEVVGAALAPRDGAAAKGPWDVVAELRETDPEAANRLEQGLTSFHPWLVVNQARTRVDFDVGPTVAAAWKKFFGLDLGFLGAVNHDDAVWQSVRARKALLQNAPDSVAAAAMLRIADNLISIER